MDDDFGDDADFSAAIATIDRAPPKIHQPTPQPLPSRAPPPPTPSHPPKTHQPTPQPLPARLLPPSTILVSLRQKGNPLLTHIRALPWEYSSEIASDYVLGATTCALFLSLKYHRLHPEYIYGRIRALGGSYNLRVLLAMVDVPAHEDPLKELAKTALVNNLTLVLAWSAPEAGRYLERFKAYERADPAAIRAHQPASYAEKLVEFVTVPRSVNKTDAVALVSAFGSVRAAVNARPEEIAGITGWGEKKVQRWCGTVREPFRVRRAAKRGVESALTSTGQENPSAGLAAPGSDPLPSKRPATGSPLWMPDDGEEEALLQAAVEADGSVLEGSRGGDTGGGEGRGEGITEGMVAALTRLRDK